MVRYIEAYIGEYASGKSEVAINRALQLKAGRGEVTLVDLDTVEPFYTLRPIKKRLEEKELRVIAWDPQEIMGFGETGILMKPEMRWALQHAGDIVLDIGYGVQGAKILDTIEGAAENADLKLYCVINTGRPMTSDVNDIITYVNNIVGIDGLVNNSHLGDHTDVDFIQTGSDIVLDAAKKLGLPVIATTADISFKEQLGSHDKNNIEVRYLERWMPSALW
ncbi:hypothetical protein [Desulfuribacillus alkaliarsenatis]|uniref:CobQ/CobB/MinD/ParA nucleotide binding domain-containing protein n=1 Tax=Desulfuribacillus alkaliarsenatis TaxID=766136 RepID=A0A1E5FYT2_9FIRM|nr:hypothetical protein [Desulfuribacillus alkaliarsenatis]OEF95729.1 hypothetical protein BHF68_11565 [Desulfuribacillus alkaliarsenatis]